MGAAELGWGGPSETGASLCGLNAEEGAAPWLEVPGKRGPRRSGRCQCSEWNSGEQGRQDPGRWPWYVRRSLRQVEAALDDPGQDGL